ncbi:hypothetical protein H0H81_007469 [Sphagnurus paluster]|uniref:Proteasome activator PA28 C-terminal domain-containing protein n=1 Tax=Sphagnurus paluster TaxID=117069 RepID=A0A9P7GR32_9AGAR|nr:hypothetical protein H0H81_007469 [Sphagnurus paluster]
MDKDIANKVEDFRKGVIKAGEDIVFNRFPAKVRQTIPGDASQLIMIFRYSLHALVQTTLATDSPFHMTHAEAFTDSTVYPPPLDASPNGPTQKKRKRDDDAQDMDDTSSSSQHARIPGRILTNKHLSQKVYDIVKRESTELAAMIDQVKLWVTLTMPKIEDGDNFGVQIQEEVLAELHRAQESAYNLRDSARQHYLSRAKICSKILKYPNLEDYTVSLFISFHIYH